MKTYNWRVYSKTIKPNNIPSNPQHVYKNDGWISWGDFLGSGVISSQLIKYRDFNKARSFVRKLELSSRSKWNIYRISNKLPSDIPKAPAQVYKGKGWINWGDWLGSGSVQYNLINYQSFNKARSFVRQLNLNSQKEWYEYCHSGDKPIDIPKNPHLIYKNTGWNGLNDWLGKSSDLGYFTYSECVDAMIKLGIDKNLKFREYKKQNNSNKRIPRNPPHTYKTDWQGWSHFFGKKVKHYLSFEEQKRKVQSFNFQSSKEFKDYIKLNGDIEGVNNNPDN